MSKLRTAFVLLLLLNLVFFAWSAGYFGPTETGRETQRLAQQLAQDKIRLLGATQPGAKPAADACRLVDGLGPAEAQRLRDAAREKGAKLKFDFKPAEEISNSWVIIPPQADRAAAEKKMTELRRLGLSGFQLVDEEGPLRFAIVLGAFTNDQQAEQFLGVLGKRGVRSARVQSMGKTVVRVQLSVRGAGADVDNVLRGLLSAYAAATLSSCAEP